jgi:hypothetical protein
MIVRVEVVVYDLATQGCEPGCHTISKSMHGAFRQDPAFAIGDFAEQGSQTAGSAQIPIELMLRTGMLESGERLPKTGKRHAERARLGEAPRCQM